MAKQKKGKFPKARNTDVGDALRDIERPGMKWKPVAMIVGAFLVLWITAAMIFSYDQGGAFGWVVVSVVGALTIAGIGFGIYIWRLTKRSAGIVDILQQATDEEGRKRAIEQLEAGDASDAMNALARAQLVARDSPQDAMGILESVDLAKAPAVVSDDIRANLGFLYLMHGRAKDARALADELRLDRQPNPKSKAMYAAVTAEAFARTGNVEEAKKLVETYDAADPEYGDVAGMLYRAQVYTFFKGKNRGLAQTAMKNLARIDPNLLAPFLGKGVNPEMGKMAKKALKGMGLAPKQKMKVQRR